MALSNTHFGYEKIAAIVGNAPRKIFFSGVGGISMNSLAKVCHTRGHIVSGYDRTPSEITRALEAAGITVYYESTPDIVEGCDVFV